MTSVARPYGNIYQQIAQQLEQDWSVKVNQIIAPNVEPQVAKLTAMYVAGEAFGPGRPARPRAPAP